MAGRAGRSLRSGLAKTTAKSFCFAAWSFFFRFDVSRASRGLWEQPWCDGDVRPPLERAQGGQCFSVLLYVDVGS